MLALWAVALLNGAYGIVELVAGFASGSQALKADSLDFLGDGIITSFGIAALGWKPAWRARGALTQGIFLGLLGISVLATTILRFSSAVPPEPEVMGLFGALGFFVNVIAASLMIRHRHGDAGVRAIWLFSRNDALGNVAVVIAAALVAGTDSPLPDLITASIIAGLFLQSSWSIIRQASAELRRTQP